MDRTVKRIIAVAAFLLGTMLVMCLAMLAVLAYLNSAPPFSFDAASGKEGLTVEAEAEAEDEAQTAVRFEVRRGESAQSVGRRLADSGLIRNFLFWYLLCRFDNEHIKTGTYRIEVPASQIAIHRMLVSGRQILLRVTIPEGFTLKKAARLLEENGICPADEFLAAATDPDLVAQYRIPGASMEGYIYPDTYLFPQDFPATRVVRKMADTFFARLAGIDEDAIAMSPEDLNRLVTLASIVEREYRMPEEAPVMAGVFNNRLGIGMALQSCATVEYVITEIQGRPHPEILTTRDIEISDPYNTYIRPGLPPGPIASPGAVAIRAVLNPSKTSYFYFRLVDQSTGRHYFSNTLDDHIRAGALYVKGGF